MLGKKKRRILLRGIFLISLLIFFSFVLGGCDKFSSFKQRPAEQGPAPYEELRTATDGITINYVPGQPPSTVLAKKNLGFNLGLFLENIGSYSSENVIVKIEGYDPSFFSVTSNQGGNQFNINSLSGRVATSPVGEKYGVTFDVNFVEELPPGIRTYNANFIANVCYAYSQSITVPFCVHQKSYYSDEELKNFACKPQNTIPVSAGQGGPLRVSKIEKLIGGLDTPQIIFKIFFENIGNGRLYSLGVQRNFCEGRTIEPWEEDTLLVWVKVGDTLLTCEPVVKEVTGKRPVYYDTTVSGRKDLPTPFALIDKKELAKKGLKERFLTCLYPIPSATTEPYTTPLLIEWDYGYVKSVKKTIKLEDPLK